MPIYEYECKTCKHTFEQLQKISEDPLKICPECDKNTLVKLISNTNFQLKGTGWYATDFKDKTPKNKNPEQNDATVSEKKESDKDTKKTKPSESKSSENNSKNKDSK